MNQKTFLECLQSTEILVADGATGTNLQARGLPRGAPSESWLFENPGEIKRLHADFLRAGANILLTNTFGASALRLESAGLVGRVDEVNRRAVELSRQAIEEAAIEDRPLFVAGSIGPSGGLLKPYGPLEQDQVFDSFAAQAQALSAAGADLLVVETQFDLNEARLAASAARQNSDLPLVVSFSYDRGMRTMMGVRPSQVAAEFGSAELAADVLGVNCGRSLEENLEALKQLRSATSLPLWFKPNAGLPKADAQGNTTYSVTPEQMGALVRDWIAAGARVVGGCCGTSPDHLAQIARNARL
ncbi:MAG: homocysteine S-methyltransferase family protein [Anaerolineales bacterium]|nr:homocysteine S-methyltransferase family protein [Anaerolineales bacterium]